MNKMLLVIDVQKDFINEYTVKIVGKIKELIDSRKYDIVCFYKIY